MSKANIEEGYQDYLESLNTKHTIGKVKNVIKGNCSKFDIEEITIFENDRALFSGNLESFLNTSEKNLYLYNEKKRIENTDALKCINFNDRKLFIFI